MLRPEAQRTLICSRFLLHSLGQRLRLRWRRAASSLVSRCWHSRQLARLLHSRQLACWFKATVV
jgi:hypothetical protein